MLNNVKIRHKLLLMVATPILGLLIFSIWNVADHYKQLQGLNKTESLTRLAVKVGTLVHEIQKERGYSSGYLNAKGEKFGEDLKKQRQKVDSEIAAVNAFVSQNGSDVAAVKSCLDAAASSIEKMKSTRDGIDTVKLSPVDAFSYYTGLINSYTDVIGAVSTTADKHEVMRQATAYFAFVKAKEECGKERATLNAVLAAGRFDDVTYQRAFLIKAGQQIYLDSFRRYGSSEAIATYEEKAKNPVFQKVEELQAAVLAKGTAGNFGIAPETWFSAITAKIDAMKEVEDSLTKEIISTAAGFARQAKAALVISLIFTIALVAVTLAGGFLVMTGITKPLAQMLQMLKDIAEGEGDLTRRLRAERRDELGEVSLWFNRFVDNVHGIVSQLASSTQEVSDSCQHLRKTAIQIAAAAEEVASQSGTVATAGEEMSATSIDISGNCLKAATASNRASETAQGGVEVVQATLVGMQRIAERVRESSGTVASLGERSEQIGAIVGTIEDIADQTNLLALNAAIEAARAGEQGRGFAVVADEVRALAERTTKATKEIGEMIRAIQSETAGAVGSMSLGVQEVEKGMESSRQSGEALQDILEVINDVTAQIHQIATAAEEQTATTGEISSNIHRINGVISETANGAHETAGAASQLSALSVGLQQVVGRFKLA